MSALYNLRHSRLKAYVIGCRAAGRTPEVPQNVADSCKPTMPLLKWQKQAWQASPKPSQGKLSTRLGVGRIHVTVDAAVCHSGWIISGFYLSPHQRSTNSFPPRHQKHTRVSAWMRMESLEGIETQQHQPERQTAHLEQVEDEPRCDALPHSVDEEVDDGKGPDVGVLEALVCQGLHHAWALLLLACSRCWTGLQ